MPVFQQASLAAGVKCSCYPSQVTFDNAAGISSLQFLMNLALKYHVAPPASEYGSNGAASTNQDVTLFSAGKVAMDVEGDWFTDTIYSSAKFPFGVLPIPTGPDGRWSFTNGLIDAINVHSPNQTAAWELEQWLGSATSEQIMGSRAPRVRPTSQRAAASSAPRTTPSSPGPQGSLRVRQRNARSTICS